jgi:hypothetical protein
MHEAVDFLLSCLLQLCAEILISKGRNCITDIEKETNKK